MTPSIRPLLLGRRPRRSLGFVALAVGLVPVSAVAYEVALHRTLGCVVLFPGYVAWAVLLSAGACGYLNDGLAVCWALGVGPTLGFGLYANVLGMSSRTLRWGVVESATSPMLIIGLTLATAAFLAGAGLRRLFGLAGVGRTYSGES